jgi:hypothetical protein
MFFTSQPDFYYPHKGENKISKNLFRRIRFRDNLNAVYLNSVRYTIKEGETPELISQERYGSTQWYWTILILNNIIDVNNDWPKTATQLDTEIYNKYGEDADKPKYWETIEIRNSSNVIVQEAGIVIEMYQGLSTQDASNYFPSFNLNYNDGNNVIITVPANQALKKITNRDYEYLQNEKKKEIYLVKNRYLPMLEKEVKELFKYDTEYKIDANGIRYSEV